MSKTKYYNKTSYAKVFGLLIKTISMLRHNILDEIAHDFCPNSTEKKSDLAPNFECTIFVFLSQFK